MENLGDHVKDLGAEMDVIDVGDDEVGKSGPPTSDVSEVSAPAKSVAESMTKKLRALNVHAVRSFRPNICRIPREIRGDNGGAYEPKIVSIGPYHQGEETLAAMEEIKLLYLHDLLARDSYNQIQYYAEAIFKLESEARREYAGPLNLSSLEFVERLVLDGCFVVEFFLKRAEGRVGPPMTGKVRNLPMLRHDLLLMENQIPFFILRTILDESAYDFPGSNGIGLLDFALHYLYKGKKRKEMLSERHQKGDGDKVYHLLHLSYLCLLEGLNPTVPRKDTPPETLALHLAKEFRVKISKIGRFFLCLIMKLRKILSLLPILLYIVVSTFKVFVVWQQPMWSSSVKKPTKKPRTIPTATELREVGMKFRKKDDTEARCYLDVSFRDGTLEMPKLHVQENSNSEFRNFLALEQNSPDVGNHFTSYVVLMDNLIDTTSDVQVLKRAGIMESKLGCDEEVTKFFNGMRSGLCFNFDRHYLVGVFEDINNFCNRDYNRWRAKLMHNYFGSPWSMLAFIGALILLALTALQTAYTLKR